MNERLPEKMSSIYGRVKYFCLAYSVAFERYGELTWKESCAEAIEIMAKTRGKRLSPKTLSCWHRHFRVHRRFRQPFEAKMSYQPIIFRIYALAEAGASASDTLPKISSS